MRAVEFIVESNLDEMASSIHGGIRTYLQNKGYKYLGGGIDKQAWLEPGTGYAYIVFGTREGHKEFTPDQRMFVDWVNYCNANKNNPHLPRFSGLESFNFRNQLYIQCRMELLQEVSGHIKTLVAHLEDAVKHIRNDAIDDALFKLGSTGYWDDENSTLGYYETKDIIRELGGREAVTSLLKTVRQVAEFGEQHGFNLDLHAGNYMQRKDGTIVVNDPFVLWIESN